MSVVERVEDAVRVVAVIAVDLERLVVEELVRVVRVVLVAVVVVVVVVGVVARGIWIGDVEWSKCGSCGRSRHLEKCCVYTFLPTLELLSAKNG